MQSFINNSCPAGYLTQNCPLQLMVKDDKVGSDLFKRAALGSTYTFMSN